MQTQYKITDQQNDRSQRYIYQALTKYAQADKIKEVCLTGVDTDSFDKVASSEFALEDLRMFPVNTMESTILSRVYFDSQKDKEPFTTKLAALIPSVEGKLKVYQELFNIPSSLFEPKHMEKEANEEKEEFPSKHLIPSKQQCKVASRQDLQEASELFDTYYQKMDIPTRIEFSQNYVKLAAEMKHSNYSQHIAKYASQLDTNLANTRRFLEYRAATAMRLKGEAQGGEYLKLASSLEEVDLADASPEDLEKLASTIYSLDKNYGLDKARKIPCAYSIVFNKEATMSPMETSIKPQDEIQAKAMTKADIIGQYGMEALPSVENQDGSLNPERVAELNKMKQIYNTQNQNQQNQQNQQQNAAPTTPLVGN